MTTVTLTAFRSQASGMFSRVGKGETLVVLRHGRPIAEVSPIAPPGGTKPSWTQPALRLTIKGAGLSSAIVAERDHEGIS